MPTFELEGKVKTKLPQQSGNSARGAWVSQSFVVEYQDGNYPADACFSVFGQDKVDELARFQVGDSVKVAFNVRSREFNGRWYTDLRVWKLSQPGAAQAPVQAPAYAAPVAPAPSLGDMPADLSDDMPF